jgi:prepilin peptidase CpaA
MDLTATEAAWLLPAALPVSLYVGWSDARTMKIPNAAVIALAAGFAVLGLMAMPLTDWLWRWVQLAVVLVIGIGLNAARLVGAGDAKFAAAAAPYIAPGDLGLLLWIYVGAFLASYLLHRLVKHSGLRRLVPDWASWRTGNRFPMGLALGATLVAYLVFGLTGLPDLRQI